MGYIDGFLVAVESAKREVYLKHAEETVAVFKDHGALKVVECWGDDVPEGTLTSFPMAVKKRENETVVFSWILWADKVTRDAGMAKAMADPRLRTMTDMPFDGKRMIFGGFEVVLDR